MAHRRSERLNEQLRREISDVLRREVRDPRVGLPTVTRVEVTADLSLARVYVRIAGTDAEREAALEGLDAATPFVRRELGARVRMRRIPELRFEIDRTLEHASRIEELLREVGPGTGHAADAEAIPRERADDDEIAEGERGVADDDGEDRDGE